MLPVCIQKFQSGCLLSFIKPFNIELRPALGVHRGLFIKDYCLCLFFTCSKWFHNDFLIITDSVCEGERKNWHAHFMNKMQLPTHYSILLLWTDWKLDSTLYFNIWQRDLSLMLVNYNSNTRPLLHVLQIARWQRQ